jgi:lactoylglutathione lyase
MTSDSAVHELRLCVTTDDLPGALAFYRDALGLPEIATWEAPDGASRVTILAAGRATLEISETAYAEYVDEVEVGRRVAGPVRVAFHVDDATAATARLEAAGGQVIAAPTRTPWDSLNARLTGAAGLQLTLFEELGPPG